MTNLTIEGLTPAYYRQVIDELRMALVQAQEIEAGKGYTHGCAICGDDHHAGVCWFHNVVLLAELGRVALLGEFWRCFHCGAVFTTEESAKEHFGETQDEVAKCLQQLADLGRADA